MVTVWFAREGSEPTRRGPAYELPLETCIETLGLTADDFPSRPERTPPYGDQSSRLGGIDDYRHVLWEIEDVEARASGWKPGYWAELSPALGYRAARSPAQGLGDLTTEKSGRDITARQKG